ncbi:MAG TPA: hypothetical protein PK335_03520 [Draconibacterium sp.]|nr:hypothetical protein [Draconibacterium sp.]
MKKKTMIWRSVFAVVLASAFLSSCIEDPEPAALNAKADVFVQKVWENGETKYAPAFIVVANKQVDSVNVEGPGGEGWSLGKDGSSSTVFVLFPETEDYTDSLPETGDYDFVITSTQTNEAPLQVTDELDEDTLGAVVIDTIGFENGKLMVEWETLEDADAYFVRLYDDSGKLIFVGNQVDDEETEFSFGPGDQGWIDSSSKAEDGDTCKLEMIAILYESGSTTNKDYNVQFISITPTEVVWGD